MALGKRVQELREAAGEDYPTLAKAIGTSPQTISAIEKRDSKRSEFAPAIAEHYKVVLHWLLTGKGPKTKAELDSAMSLAVKQIKSRFGPNSIKEMPGPLPPDVEKLARRIAGVSEAYRPVLIKNLNQVLDGDIASWLSVMDTLNALRDKSKPQEKAQTEDDKAHKHPPPNASGGRNKPKRVA